MLSHAEQRSHIVKCPWCDPYTGNSGSAAYYTALEHQAPPGATADPSQQEAATDAAANAAQQQPLPAEQALPQQRHHLHHHKHHRHQRRVSSAAAPPANPLSEWLVVPGMTEVQPYVRSHQVPRAVPDLAVAPAYHGGGYPAAGSGKGASTTTAGRGTHGDRHARLSCKASTSRLDSECSGASSAYRWDHGVITGLEMCLAFAVLVFVGVLLLFLFITTGVWPFHGGATTTARIETVLDDAGFQKGYNALARLSRRASSTSGGVLYTEYAYATRMPAGESRRSSPETQEVIPRH